MGYAVQLYFDAALEASMRELRAALTRAGVTPTLDRLGDRPHVSLAVLEELPVQRCKDMLERFAETEPPFGASFAAFAAFPTTQGVVYLGPTPSEALLDTHREMHRLITELGVKVHEHYLPGAWIPHSTIGFELPGEEVTAALSWLHGHFKPVAGTFSSIGVISFTPVTPLGAYDLRGPRRAKTT